MGNFFLYNSRVALLNFAVRKLCIGVALIDTFF
jgi:hypothetical protein